MELIHEDDLTKKTKLLELLVLAGIYAKDLVIENVLGYGGEVYVVQTDIGEFVIKLFKDFSPYPTIPYYAKSRVATDVEVYEKLNQLDNTVVPDVLYFDAAEGILILSKVDNSYTLFEDVVKENKEINPNFYSSFAKFLYNKAVAIEPHLDHVFYSVEDAKHLRSLFVEDRYLSTVDAIFKKGLEMPQALNLGGLSPKNMFICESKFKLIDFEEAFIGDYTYDPGFFVGHMLIYHKLNANNGIVTGLRDFAKTFNALAKLTKEEKTQMISYAGLMILHRSGGFNIKGSFKGMQQELINFGEQLLHGNDVVGLHE